MPEDQESLNLEPCAFCGNPSELLCDYVIGFACAGNTEDDRPEIPKYAKRPPRRFISMKSEMFTCDTPFCANCGANLEQMFFCGSNPSVETVDHCMIHASMAHRGDGVNPVYPAEVESARREIRIAVSKARMTGMRLVGPARHVSQCTTTI